MEIQEKINNKLKSTTIILNTIVAISAIVIKMVTNFSLFGDPEKIDQFFGTIVLIVTAAFVIPSLVLLLRGKVKTALYVSLTITAIYIIWILSLFVL